MIYTAAFFVFAVILFGLSIRAAVSGIAGLSNTEYTEPSISAKDGKLCEAEIVGAGEVYTIERRLLGFIPIGTERFFLCENEDGTVPLLVKASASWYEKNFDMYGFAKETLTVTGEVRDFEYERRGDINRIDDALPNAVLGHNRISASSYLCLTYKKKYILEIVSGALNIIAAAVLAVTVKLQRREGIGLALCGAAALFAIFVLLCSDFL